MTWLPNQLGAVLDVMEDVYRGSNLAELVSCECAAGLSGHRYGNAMDLTRDDLGVVKGIIATVVLQREKLRKEVERFCTERGV